MRQPTGVKRLDELLKGGLPPNTFALVHGPPFLGKDLLARLFLLHGCRLGIPGILLTTDESAANERRRLAALDPAFPKYEESGLVRFVDTYSRAIGAADAIPTVQYVDGAMDLNGIAVAVNDAQRRVVPDHPQHRLVVDSLSTLVTYTNAATVFRFLQVFVGRTRMAGATGLLLVEGGMHTDAEVQMLKHVADGVVDLRTEGGKNLLHVQGVGVTENPGWVEYRFTETEFDVVGSFASGRIK